MSSVKNVEAIREAVQEVSLPSFRIVEVDDTKLGIIYEMNREIFDEERIINTFDRRDLLMLLAYVDETPVGFKIGYQRNRKTYYSAKGGVLPAYRRQGIARALLYDMMERARRKGYRRFVFDTFPNKHPGMTILGLQENFRVTGANYNSHYQDYRIRLEKEL